MVARKWYSRVVPMHPSMRFTPNPFGELAQGKRRDGQVVDRPVADGEDFNPPDCWTSACCAAGKGALHLAELRKAKLLGELRVERDLRAPGVDEEGGLLAAVYAHADQGQRIGL